MIYRKGTIEVNANTVASAGQAFHDAEKIGLTLKVGNDTAADVKVQGGWDGDSDADADWIDTAIAETGLNDTHGQFGPSGEGTIPAVWPYYRVVVTSAGTNTVEWLLAGFGAE